LSTCRSGGCLVDNGMAASFQAPVIRQERLDGRAPATAGLMCLSSRRCRRGGRSLRPRLGPCSPR
jgi:hypothetical protein